MRGVRAPGAIVWLTTVIAAVAIGAAVFAVTRSGIDDATGDPGRLTERNIPVPPDIAVPRLVDATASWNLDTLVLEAAADGIAGGSAVADLDRDGDLDLLVANGELAIALWDGDAYVGGPSLGIDGAIAVTTADVDGDGWIDILVASRDADTIVWGGRWVTHGNEPASTELDTAGRSSGLLVAELSGDEHLDVVRLGHGPSDPVPDVLWIGSGERVFSPIELPHPGRFSLAAEIVDIDDDGLLDLWIVRDIGWAAGGDSVLSRETPTGTWRDVAPDLGTDLEIDAMGVTIADLDGDARLDAYVSDLGDNEVLQRTIGGFGPVHDTGAARIRPPGTTSGIVSSSWGSGVADLNLDGIADLVVNGGGFPTGSVQNKIEGTDVAVEEPPAVLLGLGDGTFVDVWTTLGLDLEIVGRGLTIADLDGDGDDDVVLVDRRGRITALRNDTPGPSVTVTAAPGCPTRGTVVTIPTTHGSITALLSPHAYAGSHGPALIAGAWDRAQEILVRWADGSRAAHAFADDIAERSTVTLDC